MNPLALWLIIYIVGVLLLTGCGPTAPLAPVYVSTPLPDIPAECDAACPPEPALPKRDITAGDIAKDRTAFKRAYRCERHKRHTCSARLKTLLAK
jgi:hypothetical protein